MPSIWIRSPLAMVPLARAFTSVMTEALAMPGPSVVEVKMGQIGALRFAGPPQKTLY